MLLLHWAAPISTTTPFRCKERVVRDFIAPALRHPIVQAACHRFYASKQADAVWLNLFSDPDNADSVIDAIRPLARAIIAADPIPNTTDDILGEDCTRYLTLLTQATRYAIDLHLQPDLVAEQQALICIACRTTDPRDDLKDHLRQFSPHYRADSVCAKWRFWKDFQRPGPRANFSHPGHWIWNIVLGIDFPSFPWPDSTSAAQAIGIPVPAC